MTLHLSPSENHRRLMAEITPRFAYNGGDVREWRETLLPEVRERTGMNEMPADRTALNSRSLWKREHPLGVIEKIAFTAEPLADVTAYLCLPSNARPPYTFMICLQGHSTGMHNSIGVQREREDLPLEVAGDRDFAIGCLRRGVAALCIEQRSFGERRERKQEKTAAHGCQDAAMHALMLGRTLIGERVFDVDRGIDYLLTRDDVDPSRIGVMGNSGGGTISVFAAALLPRLAFAMPSCSFCTFRDSILSIGHCTDNYVPGLLKVAEMADVLGLFAPKPVVVVAGLDDPIFPIEATRRAFKDLEKIYRAAGAGDRCRLVVGSAGHRFAAEDAWPEMRNLLDSL